MALLTRENQTLNLMLYNFAKHELNVTKIKQAYDVLCAK